MFVLVKEAFVPISRPNDQNWGNLMIISSVDRSTESQNPKNVMDAYECRRVTKQSNRHLLSVPILWLFTVGKEEALIGESQNRKCHTIYITDEDYT